MRAVEKSGAGVITRWRGSDYTSRFPQIDRNPLGGGLSARGSDCTWITVAIHRVFPQIGGMVTAGAHQVAGSVAKGGGCDFTSGTGDADTVASSPRCRHQHEAQRCRNGMTKGIEARRGRDLEQGSMRSTKARPRPRRGEPIKPWTDSTAWPRWCGKCAARTASRPALQAFPECGPVRPGRTTGLLSGASETPS